MFQATPCILDRCLLIRKRRQYHDLLFKHAVQKRVVAAVGKVGPNGLKIKVCAPREQVLKLLANFVKVGLEGNIRQPFVEFVAQRRVD